MYRIERLQEGWGRDRWVPADDAKYESIEDAAAARRRAVHSALQDAPAGSWRTPRFRIAIVEARQVVACATMQ